LIFRDRDRFMTGKKSLFVRTRYVRIARLRRNRWRDRIMSRLAQLEDSENNPHFQDDYRIAWMTVLNCSEGHADAWRYSFWCYFGKVPEKIIPELVAREAKRRRLDIPDYDPLSDPLSKVRSFPSRPGPMYQMPVSSWADEQDSLRNSQEEERGGQPRVSVCAESICLCALHLQLAREASLASYVRKRLAMGKTVQRKNRPTWQRLAEPAG
jgi:hypothetical protein